MKAKELAIALLSWVTGAAFSAVMCVAIFKDGWSYSSPLWPMPLAVSVVQAGVLVALCLDTIVNGGDKA